MMPRVLLFAEVDRHGNLFATGPGGVQVFAPDGARLGRLVVGVPLGNVAWGADGALFVAANHWIVRVQTRPARREPGGSPGRTIVESTHGPRPLSPGRRQIRL